MIGKHTLFLACTAYLHQAVHQNGLPKPKNNNEFQVFIENILDSAIRAVQCCVNVAGSCISIRFQNPLDYLQAAIVFVYLKKKYTRASLTLCRTKLFCHGDEESTFSASYQ